MTHYESNCPNSDYQTQQLRKQLEIKTKECSKYKEALIRIKNTYDNVEDLAGVIAKEALRK
jgi:hypothetical protein